MREDCDRGCRVDGQEIPTIDHVSQLLLTLQGAGVLTFPSTRDAGGNRRYELDTLDLPDRKDTWEQALNRYDAGILKAYLVPPSLAGVDDLGATGAKILDGMLKEYIQDFAVFAADHMSALVKTVHARNHGPARVPPPDILAYEVPASVRKLYLEVLRLLGGSKNNDPAAWVDAPALLDQLGVPLRTAPLEAGEKEAKEPGRGRDLTGQREERREDARTHEGEDAVGAPGETEDAEQTPMPVDESSGVSVDHGSGPLRRSIVGRSEVRSPRRSSLNAR